MMMLGVATEMPNEMDRKCRSQGEQDENAIAQRVLILAAYWGYLKSYWFHGR